MTELEIFRPFKRCFNCYQELEQTETVNGYLSCCNECQNFKDVVTVDSLKTNLQKRRKELWKNPIPSDEIPKIRVVTSFIDELLGLLEEQREGSSVSRTGSGLTQAKVPNVALSKPPFPPKESAKEK